MVIYGLNPVLEALRAGRATTVRVSRRDDLRLKEVLRLAAAGNVPVRHVEAAELDRAARGGTHQGVMAAVSVAREFSIGDLVAAAPGPSLLVVLDGIEDPQNLGAILRAADAAGADGVIRQTRHAAPLGGVAAKASAGAVAHTRIANVVNVARALEECAARGVWTVGLAADAPRTCYDVDLTLPVALVLGAEGTGLRRLVRERCDLLASIPMRGHVDSLNVAAAAAVVLFEAVRQRHGGPIPGRKSP
jgi:23S rRNA (guanosine2251-2'-O)-methyltransferase